LFFFAVITALDRIAFNCSDSSWMTVNRSLLIISALLNSLIQ
jgi:hypothetical protein